MNRDAEHARHLSERRRDVVAVADERDCAAATIAPSLAQRERIGERLARMLFVGERVDDVQVAPGGGQRRRLLLRERANDEGADPSLQVARDVLKRLARAFCRVRPGDGVSPPSSRIAISKVERVRSDGFSNSRATCKPASAVANGPGVRAAGPPSFVPRRAATGRDRLETDRGSIESLAKCGGAELSIFPDLRQATGEDAIDRRLRSILVDAHGSALRSHVQIVAD